MPLLDRIKKGISEFNEQAAIVAKSYGGSKLRWVLSMVWCLLRYGARPIDYVRFEFHKKSSRERNRYLTIYRYFRLLKKFGAYNDDIHGKIAEYKTFSDYIRRPWIVADVDTDQQIIKDFITKQGVVFAKPNFGEQGKGVMKIEASNDNAINELLDECKKSAYVVEGVIEQDTEIATINQSSVNTVRVTTLTDKDGCPQIFSVILRAGAPGSHVDNWGAGGVGYNFNLETGICDQYGKDKKNQKYIFHPGSNRLMIGYKLPHFEELKEYVIKMSHLVPESKYIGWDIAITKDGFDLVEMNCPAGHDMFQSFNNPVYDTMKNIF